MSWRDKIMLLTIVSTKHNTHGQVSIKNTVVRWTKLLILLLLSRSLNLLRKFILKSIYHSAIDFYCQANSYKRMTKSDQESRLVLLFLSL